MVSCEGGMRTRGMTDIRKFFNFFIQDSVSQNREYQIAFWLDAYFFCEKGFYCGQKGFFVF